MKAEWVDIVAPKAPAHIMICMFNLYIDADACPVKEECYRVAKRYALPVLVVANCTMRIPVDPSVTMVVQTGFGAADDWIAEQIGPGDIAITVDVPLAARGGASEGSRHNPRRKDSQGLASTKNLAGRRSRVGRQDLCARRGDRARTAAS